MKSEDLLGLIKSSATSLPNIRPLKEFLHLNMFPGHGNMSFWKSLEENAHQYAMSPFPGMDYYRNLYSEGEINEDILNHEIALQAQGDEAMAQLLKNHMFENKRRLKTPERGYRPIHSHLSTLIDHSLEELTGPQIVRFLSLYLDQGLAQISMPWAHEHGLFKTISLLVQNSIITVPPLGKWAQTELLTLEPIDCILKALALLFESENDYRPYIDECLFPLKGWSGLISTLEKAPGLLIEKRQASLVDMLALRLTLELSWIREIKGSIQRLPPFSHHVAQNKSPLKEIEFLAFKTWHIALEKSYYQQVLMGVIGHRPPPQKSETYTTQILFCIDDRECSLRRFVEKLNPQIETFGTPGHFGLDFYYQHHDEAIAEKHCPAPLQTAYLIKNISKNKIKQNKSLSHLGHALTGGFKKIFSVVPKIPGGVSCLTNQPPLDIFREESQGKEKDGFFHGYTYKELAKRLNDVMRSIGLGHQFSPLILVLGHGSNTTNNPYFMAYGCGACSGRTGNINARVFAMAANHPSVRAALKSEFSISIPNETFFISGIHDTCQDSIFLYDTNTIPTSHQKEFERLKFDLGNALKKNAALRASSFALIPKGLSNEQALYEVSKRAWAIFEPRPELGHTGNALCFVGRRSISRGLSFDRRAFLQSYDPFNDPEGLWLSAILSAAVPVCGGINLDYLFSRMNNRRFGAGSKLSQNVVGLFAVSNGTEDDLLTGLPYQMVELHTPLRILILVEQKISIIEQVFKRHPAVYEWVQNEWVCFALIDPQTRDIHFFENGEFKHRPGAHLC